jgi:chromosome segregation ATPase
MPDELDEIRRRLETLESRMNHESDLRAMMDLDQASLSARFDAQDRLLRALSHTQSDHTARLTRLEDGLIRIEGGLIRLDGRVTNVEGKVTRVEGRLTRVEGRLTRVEGVLTRVEDGLTHVEAGVARAESGVQAILALLQGNNGDN